MSTEMKSFLTTLDLVTQDKVEPETVVEEDEEEEILTINEDGEIIVELHQGGRNWQGDDEANYPTRVTPKRNVGRRNLGDVEGIPKVADVDAQTQAVDDFSSEHPVPASLQQKLQKIPRWLWDTYLDASQSMGRGVMDAGKTVGRGVMGGVMGAGRHLGSELKGIGDFGKRRYDAAKAIMNSSYTIEDANIILEDYESIMSDLFGGEVNIKEAYKKGRPRRKGGGRRKIDDLMSSKEQDEENTLQELNDIKRLSGLKEEVGDNPIVTGQYHGELRWSIEGEEDGFQVYIMGPHGWIAQGQPHATEEEAVADAKSFFD